MAASKWQVYHEAKQNILSADLDINAATLRMKIVKGTDAATVSNYTRSSFASSTGTAVAWSGTTTVRTPANVSVRISSTSVIVFDSDAVVFTASGALTSLLYAVIGLSAGRCIAWCKLTSTGSISLGAGSTLTITPAANGYFTLSGGTTA